MFRTIHNLQREAFPGHVRVYVNDEVVGRRWGAAPPPEGIQGDEHQKEEHGVCADDERARSRGRRRQADETPAVRTWGRQPHVLLETRQLLHRTLVHDTLGLFLVHGTLPRGIPRSHVVSWPEHRPAELHARGLQHSAALGVADARARHASEPLPQQPGLGRVELPVAGAAVPDDGLPAAREHVVVPGPGGDQPAGPLQQQPLGAAPDTAARRHVELAGKLVPRHQLHDLGQLRRWGLHAVQGPAEHAAPDREHELEHTDEDARARISQRSLGGGCGWTLWRRDVRPVPLWAEGRALI